MSTTTTTKRVRALRAVTLKDNPNRPKRERDYDAKVRALTKQGGGRVAVEPRLYLVVQGTGAASFVYRYTDAAGKSRWFTLCAYERGIEEARELAADAAKQLSTTGRQALTPVMAGAQPENVEPLAALPHAEDKSALSLGVWLMFYLHQWQHKANGKATWGASTFDLIVSRLRTYVAGQGMDAGAYANWPLRHLWETPIAEVKMSDLCALLRSIHDGTHPASTKATPATAERMRPRFEELWKWAPSRGAENIRQLSLDYLDGETVVHGNLPATTDLNRLGEILAAIEALPRQRECKDAAILQAMTTLRVGTLVKAKWSAIHFEADEEGFPFPYWEVPRADCKKDDARLGNFIIPLDGQTLDYLRDMYARRAPGKRGEFLFPGQGVGKPIDTSTVRKFYRESLGLAGEMVGHGWRTAYTTWAKNQFKDADKTLVYEVQQREWVLDHEVKTESNTEKHYTRAAWFERAEQMQPAAHDWANVIHRLRAGERFVKLKTHQR